MKTALAVFDEVFAAAYPGASWDAWRAFLAALFGLPASGPHAEIIRACTGRQTLPAQSAREAWMIVGRRGGKSRVAAFLAVFAACFRSYRLAAGERGVVMVLAADRKQARVIFRYVVALLDAVPMLAALVEDKTKESITLTTGVVIEIHTASFKSVRGYTVVAAIADELAFWSVDDAAANPDAEILKALRPAMATVPDALLVVLSSPYARKGELWRTYHEHFGVEDDPVLVWQAASRTMNPDLDARVVADAYEADEAAAAAEYGAEFRKDIETFLTPDVLTAAVIPDRDELPPSGSVAYAAFTDPAGGTGRDSYTLAIAHLEGSRVVLDCVREVRPPFSPEVVTQQFAEVVRRYGVGVREVRGDHYAGAWPAEQWQKHGIRYRSAERTKSELYLELLPLLTSGRVALLDHAGLKKQLGSLERRTSRAGRDSVDHPPRGRDDVANAVAGAVVWAADAARTRPALAVVRATPEGSEGSAAMRMLRAAKTERLRMELEEMARRTPVS